LAPPVPETCSFVPVPVVQATKQYERSRCSVLGVPGGPGLRCDGALFSGTRPCSTPMTSTAFHQPSWRASLLAFPYCLSFSPSSDLFFVLFLRPPLSHLSPPDQGRLTGRSLRWALGSMPAEATANSVFRHRPNSSGRLAACHALRARSVMCESVAEHPSPACLPSCHLFLLALSLPRPGQDLPGWSGSSGQAAAPPPYADPQAVQGDPVA